MVEEAYYFFRLKAEATRGRWKLSAFAKATVGSQLWTNEQDTIWGCEDDVPRRIGASLDQPASASLGQKNG